MRILKIANILVENANKRALEEVKKIFPQAQMAPSIRAAKDYIINIGPKIVYAHIISCRSLKACSSTAPTFGAVASKDGFATLITPSSGHYYNTMLTEEGPLGVDFTMLQFEVAELSEKISNSDYKESDPYGERRAIKILLDRVYKNPFETIRIWKADYPLGYPPYKEGLSGELKLTYNDEDPEYNLEQDISKMDEPYEV